MSKVALDDPKRTEETKECTSHTHTRQVRSKNGSLLQITQHAYPEKLVQVVAHIEVRELRVKGFEILSLHRFEHQARRLIVRVLHNVEQRDDVGAAT